MDFIIRATVIGVGATVLIDLWAQLLRRMFGVPSLGYAMVGRWLGHMRTGRFIHASIAGAAPIYGEAAIGWAAHYVTGMIFAAILLLLCGDAWIRNPSLAPALAFGLVTVTVPFFVMQPGMGLGLAASKTPRPNAARLRSLVTHGVFGVGLYGMARISAWLAPQ